MAGREQMKIDFIEFASKAFVYFTEEEKRFFTRAPYHFAEIMAKFLKEMNLNTIMPCVRILGDLFLEGDALSLHVICTKSEELELLKSFQRILVHC